MLGVDLLNIIDSSSNGFELLQFFEDAVEVQCRDEYIVLERGDCVVMEYCLFHYGHFVEPILRDPEILIGEPEKLFQKLFLFAIAKKTSRVTSQC